MMSTLAINPAAIAPAQHAFQSVLPVEPGTICNDADYERVVAFMNSLLCVVGDDEAHELADLPNLVGQLVEASEGTRHVIADAGRHEVLLFCSISTA